MYALMVIDELKVNPGHLLPLRHFHRVACPFGLVDIQVALCDHLEVCAVVHNLHGNLLAALFRALREFNERITDLRRRLGCLPEVGREEDLVLGLDYAVVVMLDNIGYTKGEVRTQSLTSTMRKRFCHTCTSAHTCRGVFCSDVQVNNDPIDQ